MTRHSWRWAARLSPFVLLVVWATVPTRGQAGRPVSPTSGTSNGEWRTYGGDLASTRLGLSDALYDRLAGAVDLVVHAGADVDWVRPYASLRDVNVGGTLEAIRFASTGRSKEFRFVSSQLVGFVPGGPGVVTEDDEWLPLAHRLPLGYAQSKAVAEALVSAAAGRGLQATIFRPGLIVGDAQTGASNPDDFVAALVKGCIELGAAPDLDWTIDAVPVDYVARAVVHLSGGTDADAGVNRYHLANPRTRHWRECVLWINLYGYPCPLVPYEEWLLRLDRDSRDPGHAPCAGPAGRSRPVQPTVELVSGSAL